MPFVIVGCQRARSWSLVKYLASLRGCVETSVPPLFCIPRDVDLYIVCAAPLLVWTTRLLDGLGVLYELGSIRNLSTLIGYAGGCRSNVAKHLMDSDKFQIHHGRCCSVSVIFGVL